MLPTDFWSLFCSYWKGHRIPLSLYWIFYLENRPEWMIFHIPLLEFVWYWHRGLINNMGTPDQDSGSHAWFSPHHAKCFQDCKPGLDLPHFSKLLSYLVKAAHQLLKTVKEAFEPLCSSNCPATLHLEVFSATAWPLGYKCSQPLRRVLACPYFHFVLFHTCLTFGDTASACHSLQDLRETIQAREERQDTPISNLSG